MSKVVEVESSFSASVKDPDIHGRGYSLSGLTRREAMKAHSLIDKDSDDPFYHHSESCVFVKAVCGKTACTV